jgi:hypothetical protein
VVLVLAQYIGMETHTKGSWIMREGDLGETMYVIVGGKASIFKKLPPPEDDTPRRKKRHGGPSFYGGSLNSTLTASNTTDNSDTGIEIARKKKEVLDDWFSFARSLPGLPRSVRNFLARSLLCVVTITVHALMLIIGIGTLRRPDYSREGFQTILYYAYTQLLFALLAGLQALQAVRHENPIEMTAATYLVGSVLVFDVSVLATGSEFAARVLKRKEPLPFPVEPSDFGEPADGFVVSVLFGTGFRVLFTCWLTACWFQMVYYAALARIDFGCAHAATARRATAR